MKKNILIVLIGIIGIGNSLLTGCSNNEKPSLLVYSGRGLESAMDEIVQDFEKEHNIDINIVYAGSKTLFSTIQKTKKGDVYIPGSDSHIKKLGDLALSDQYVALHVPALAVRIDNKKNLQTYEDVLKPGVRIAIGNKDMCAIGGVTDKIIKESGRTDAFKNNIYITASTVTELLELVVKGDVDTAFIWTDMVNLPGARDIKMIEIDKNVNKIENIHVAVLSTTVDKENATLFANYVSSHGKAIFIKHGFGNK